MQYLAIVYLSIYLSIMYLSTLSIYHLSIYHVPTYLPIYSFACAIIKVCLIHPLEELCGNVSIFTPL